MRRTVTRAARQRFDFADYVLLEEHSTVKHEYLDGAVWAMAGGSPEHARIAANVAALLRAQQIESLREVALVANDSHAVDVWRRTDAGWVLVPSSPSGASLESVDCRLSLEDVYSDPLVDE